MTTVLQAIAKKPSHLGRNTTLYELEARCEACVDLMTFGKIVISSVLIASAAYALNCYAWGMADAFQRSGSLIVASSVAFFYLYAWLHRNAERVRRVIDRIEKVRRRSLGALADDIDPRARWYQPFILFGRSIQRVKGLEVLFGVVGTLIWGYGDLLLAERMHQ